MPTVSDQPHPHAIHLGVGWEIAVVTTFVLVIIAVSTVAICQLTRKEPDLRNIEPESGVRSDKHWPASILNKRRRRRKKSRKKKAKDPDMTTIESEEIEVIEFEEEDIAMDGVGTVGVSDSGRQVDVPKPTQCKLNSPPLSQNK